MNGQPVRTPALQGQGEFHSATTVSPPRLLSSTSSYADRLCVSAGCETCSIHWASYGRCNTQGGDDD
jgi:hypothetical protein